MAAALLLLTSLLCLAVSSTGQLYFDDFPKYSSIYERKLFQGANFVSNVIDHLKQKRLKLISSKRKVGIAGEVAFTLEFENEYGTRADGKPACSVEVKQTGDSFEIVKNTCDTKNDFSGRTSLGSPFLGPRQAVNPENFRINGLARFAVMVINARTTSKTSLALVKVVRGTQEVSNGIIYRLLLLVAPSTCHKSTVDRICEPHRDIKPWICEVTILMQTKLGKMEMTRYSCA